MDLRKSYQFWFVQVLLLCINAKVNSELTCLPGIKTPGYTVPQGDIILEYGEPLDLVCVLYDSAIQKYGVNASHHLMYKRNDEIIPPEMIEILNSTSIRLHIDKPPKVTTDSYTCLFEKRSVCMNLVTVGTKPRMVDDFECVGYNYENLTCSWTPAQNYVRTTYGLTYTLRGRASRYVAYSCPDLKYPTKDNPKMSCFWNVSTTPQYRQAHSEFYFTLTMSNDFGSIQLNRTFKHFQHVLPGPPENLTVIETTPSSIYLTWVIPFAMKNFPPGVHHRILYQCTFCEKKWHFGGLITHEPNANTVRFNLTDLKYAHALYDIRVAIRSADALVGDESMWSKNASTTIRTSSKLPDKPPKTNMGSFETVASGSNLQYREAYIYWQQISEWQMNGPDFKYFVMVEGNSSLLPVEQTNAYAKFKNLLISKSYLFNIWSKNSDGLSREKSIVYIPKQTERIPEPVSFTKVEFGDGKYELTWGPPKLTKSQVIRNYTIFWCDNDRDRPYQCKGNLTWKEVPSDITVHNETVSSDTLYQFAISANGPESSSGMLWAACTVIHNKNMGKMKNVVINQLGSTFIELGWKLDCSDRIGSVEGFIIYYCPILSPTQAECKGPQKNVTIYGDSTIVDQNVTNLTPYTTYMLTVAVITKHTTFSQQSDPLFNTTLEAAPSTPPLDVKITNVTNSSISLTWLKPEATNGILKYYVIEYNNYTKEIDPKDNRATLENLSSFEKYRITMQACTTLCSHKSEPITVTTNMGYPGKIRQPTASFLNATYITILWDKPDEPRGLNDYYEVQFTQEHQSENKTIPVFKLKDRKYNIANCGDNGKFNTFFLAVRAVNLIDGVPHEGPWSEELQSYCRSVNNYMYYVICVASIILMATLIFAFYNLYLKLKDWRNINPKLSAGMKAIMVDTGLPFKSEKITPSEEPTNPNSPADEEHLLVRLSEVCEAGRMMHEGGERHLSGESSGCSSGDGSVSSMQSGTNISNDTEDSGTAEQQAEQPPSPSRSPSPLSTPQQASYCVLGQPLNNNSTSDTTSAVVDMLNGKTSFSNEGATNTDSYEINKNNGSPYVAIAALEMMTSKYNSPPPASTVAATSENEENESDVVRPNDNSSAYVLSGNVVKTMNPGYVTYDLKEEPLEKGSAYVMAGTKNNGYIPYNHHKADMVV